MATRPARPAPRSLRRRASRPPESDSAAVFRVESTDYFLLLGTTLFLVVFGLVMVLSSSSIESRIEDGDFFAQASRQGLYALVGLPLMLIASRMPERFWKRIAWPLLIASCAPAARRRHAARHRQSATTELARDRAGQFQPSEVIKVALVIWLGLIVTKKRHCSTTGRRASCRSCWSAAAAIGLVLLGNDLGTAIIMVAMVLGALFLIGVRLRLLLLPILAAIAVFVLVAVSSDSRMRRITVVPRRELQPAPATPSSDCWQIQHGTLRPRERRRLRRRPRQLDGEVVVAAGGRQRLHLRDHRRGARPRRRRPRHRAVRAARDRFVRIISFSRTPFAKIATASRWSCGSSARRSSTSLSCSVSSPCSVCRCPSSRRAARR